MVVGGVGVHFSSDVISLSSARAMCPAALPLSRILLENHGGELQPAGPD